MRISDWSSDVCSSDLPMRTIRSALTRDETDAARGITSRSTSRRRRYPGRARVYHLHGFGEESADRRRAQKSWYESTPGVRTQRSKDRKSVGSGKSVSVRVDLGGRRIIKKKNK